MYKKIKVVTNFEIDDRQPIMDAKEMIVEDAIYRLSDRVARIEYVLRKMNACL